MDSVPTTPGFYIRRAIPDEVFHLETVTYIDRVSYKWRLWVVGGSRPLDVPHEEMVRITAVGDFVALLPERPSRVLAQGDVKLGDDVRLRVDGRLGAEGSGHIEGKVYELGSNGGVVGTKVGGVWFAAGLPFVELLS